MQADIIPATSHAQLVPLRDKHAEASGAGERGGIEPADRPNHGAVAARGLSDPPVNESDVALERRVLRDESPADDFIEAFLSSPPQTGLGSRRTQAIPTQKAHHKL